MVTDIEYLAAKTDANIGGTKGPNPQPGLLGDPDDPLLDPSTSYRLQRLAGPEIFAVHDPGDCSEERVAVVRGEGQAEDRKSYFDDGVVAPPNASMINPRRGRSNWQENRALSRRCLGNSSGAQPGGQWRSDSIFPCDPECSPASPSLSIWLPSRPASSAGLRWRPSHFRPVSGEGPSGKLESVSSRKTETLKGGELGGGRSARTPALLGTQGNARSQAELGMWRGRARRGHAGQAFPPKAKLHGQSSFRIPGPVLVSLVLWLGLTGQAGPQAPVPGRFSLSVRTITSLLHCLRAANACVG